jgi:hypothetical protein
MRKSTANFLFAEAAVPSSQAPGAGNSGGGPHAVPPLPTLASGRTPQFPDFSSRPQILIDASKAFRWSIWRDYTESIGKPNAKMASKREDIFDFPQINR